MEEIADVDIDANGVYKYILIKVTDKKISASKVIVRGYSWADYHGEHLLARTRREHRIDVSSHFVFIIHAF